MSTTTTAPGPAPATQPATDRRGLIGGLALGAVMVAIALVVALTGPGVPDARPTAVTGSTGTQTVQVTLAGMRVSPAVIEIAAGTRLVLEVTNTDGMRHDLSLSSGHQTPMLATGESATLDLGVVDADMEGWCTVPGHRAAGMTLDIVATGTGGDEPPTSDGSHDMGDMPGTGAGASEAAALDPGAAPGPDWQPFDPNLAPLPGATEHTVRMVVSDTVTEVAPGVRQTLWTFNGTAPGPTLHGSVGDLFTITFVNEASTGHGIDFHAGALAPDEPMRTIDPGEELTYQFVATGSGAWLYHCSTMPMSLHMANGMYGAVIIEPPGLPPVDTELVLVQSELYLGPQDGTADEAAIAAETPSAVVFNGYVDQYVHAPIEVRAGDRIRIWVVDAGPQRPTAFHVVGAQFDTVFKEGAYLLRPGNAEQGRAQVLDLAPAQGGFVELVLPEAGHYTFVDHAMVDGERGARGILDAS